MASSNPSRMPAAVCALGAMAAGILFAFFVVRPPTSPRDFPAVKAIQELLQRYPRRPTLAVTSHHLLYVNDVPSTVADVMVLSSENTKSVMKGRPEFASTSFVDELPIPGRSARIISIAHLMPPKADRIRGLFVKLDLEHRLLLVIQLAPEKVWSALERPDAVKEVRDALGPRQLKRSMIDDSLEVDWGYAMQLDDAEQAAAARTALELTMFGASEPLPLWRRWTIVARASFLLTSLLSLCALFLAARYLLAVARMLSSVSSRVWLHLPVLLFTPARRRQLYLDDLEAARNKAERSQLRLAAEREESAARARRLAALREAHSAAPVPPPPAREPDPEEVDALVSMLQGGAAGPDTSSAVRDAIVVAIAKASEQRSRRRALRILEHARDLLQRDLATKRGERA